MRDYKVLSGTEAVKEGTDSTNITHSAEWTALVAQRGARFLKTVVSRNVSSSAPHWSGSSDSAQSTRHGTVCGPREARAGGGPWTKGLDPA